MTSQLPQDLVLNIYKKSGETPLERLSRLRSENPVYKDSVLSYAGRLDPLAEGVLPVLVDGANKSREKYLHLDKSYIVDILFGITTDSYDVLGMAGDIKDPVYSEEKVFSEIKTFIGTRDQAYPPYSSKPVGGKSLREWAREGTLGTITIPTKSVTISRADVVNVWKICSHNLEPLICQKVGLVHGDFRQKEIIDRWHDVFRLSSVHIFPVIRIAVDCSSGTYMRTIAHELGERLGIGALALNITRTRVGEWTLDTSLR